MHIRARAVYLDTSFVSSNKRINTRKVVHMSCAATMKTAAKTWVQTTAADDLRRRAPPLLIVWGGDIDRYRLRTSDSEMYKECIIARFVCQ